MCRNKNKDYREKRLVCTLPLAVLISLIWDLTLRCIILSGNSPQAEM